MQYKKHFIDILFIIVLIGVFAMSSVLLTVLGVHVYESSSEKNAGDDVGVGALYFAQKIRQCDSIDTVRIDSVEGGIPALVIEKETPQATIETWCYVYNGFLKEISSIKGNTIYPDTGQDILPLRALEFDTLDSGMLKITLVSRDSEETSIMLNTAIGKGGI